MQLNGSLIGLDSLVFRIGRGRAIQHEAVTVVGKCFDHVGKDIGVEILAVEFAVHVNVNSIAGIGLALGSFAG